MLSQQYMDTTKKPEDSLSIEQAAFDAIERDFHEVFAELAGDTTLQRFRHEYERLHRALKKSHENERRLIARVKELGTEIVANAAKVRTAMQLSNEDQATITSLRRETERMWRLVDQAHERESRAKDTISRLKAEIASLSKLIESSGGVTLQEEGTIVELLRHKQSLRAEADILKQQVDDLRAQCADLGDRNRAIEAEKLTSEASEARMRELVTSLSADVEREESLRRGLEERCRGLETAANTARNETAESQTALQAAEERRVALERQIRDAQNQIEGEARARSAAEATITRLQQDINQQIELATRLRSEARELATQLTDRDRQIRALAAAEKRTDAARQKLVLRAEALAAERDQTAQRLQDLYTELHGRENEISLAERDIAAERARTQSVEREQRQLQTEVRRGQAAAAAAADAQNVVTMERTALEKEVQAYKAESTKQRRIIHVLEQERELAGADAARLTSDLHAAHEEIRLRELAITDLRVRLKDVEASLASQQSLYETTRGERNVHAHRLANLEDELSELQREHTAVQLQLQLAADELKAKDEALVREHFERRRTERAGEQLRATLDATRARTESAEESLAHQQAEIAKLHHIVNDTNARLAARERTRAAVEQQRDFLASELQQRRTQLAYLHEKVRVLESQLRNGEAAYLARLGDIKKLRAKLRELVGSLNAAKKRGASVEEGRREVVRLNSELLAERVKVRALSAELTNPLNVHRWRRLEGADPTSYELLKKVQQLQRRLILKTEAAAEKDALIREKEEAYRLLRETLARQPGVEIHEQLSVYQTSLAEKTKALRAVSAEVTMHKGENDELRETIARLEGEIRAMKERYYALKRRGRDSAAPAPASRDGQQSRERFPLQPLQPGQPRFVGAGFNVTPQQRAEALAAAPAAATDAEVAGLAEQLEALGSQRPKSAEFA